MTSSNNSPDQFTTILPCHVSFSNNKVPFPCTLVLDITKEDAFFLIYKSDGQSIRFDYQKYDTLYVHSEHCIFSNKSEKSEKNEAGFYFFNDNTNFKRFIFSLADAGLLLVPSLSLSVRDSVVVIPFTGIHSFVPTGNYNFKNFPINRHVASIIRSQILSATKENPPFDPRFIENVALSYYKSELAKYNKWKKVNTQKLISQMNFKVSMLLVKFLKKIEIQDDYHQYKARMLNDQNLPPGYTTNFSVVDKDAARTNCNSKYWTDELKAICCTILKVVLYQHHIYYLQGNFDVIMKISLLLKGETLISEEVSIPSEIQNYSSEEFETFLYSCYYYFARTFYIEGSTESNVLERILSNISNIAFKAYDKLTPCTSSYLKLKNIESFHWSTDDLAPIFSRTFDNIWILWYWIMSTSKPFVAISLIHASLLFISIPQLINQHIQDGTEVVNYWPNFKRSIMNNMEELKKLLELSTYFYLEALKNE